MDLLYGKKIISYFNGQPTEKIEYSISVLIKDKSTLLNEIIKAIDLISTKQTHSITLHIKADDDYNLHRIITEYVGT